MDLHGAKPLERNGIYPIGFRTIVLERLEINMAVTSQP